VNTGEVLCTAFSANWVNIKCIVMSSINHEEENVTTDEPSASTYEYEHEEGDQSMGNGDGMVVENNAKDNRNEMDTGMKHNSVRNDCQPPVAEIDVESMVEKQGMVLKHRKTH